MVESDPLQQLASVLQYTLSAEKGERKRAEDYLQSVEASANYGLLLLRLLTTESVTPVIRTAAAVTFKNFIKRNWRIVEGEPTKITENDRLLIKTNIVELMLKSPESIQKQLSDAISIIGREDFPEKWKDLIGNLTAHMAITENLNLHTVNGVLQTAHSLFKRFRYEFKSQNLWQELAFVLSKFAQPLLELFEHMISKIEPNMNNPDSLKTIFTVLIMISKLFYCLNYQDLPEFFEDNINRWMVPFHMLIITDFKVLETDDTDEAGPLEKIRSHICDNVTLYAQKYDEEFGPYLPNFVGAIWNLLVSTGVDVKHDLLVSNAIKFLASVCERPHYKDLFSSQDTLQSICEKVIVPNMMFRDADEELFEDNAEEYIRKDIEGSDNDTRRRAACDLVRGLCKYFEQLVTDIFSSYVNAMLGQYTSNPAENWKSKDAAIYIVTSLAAKKSTAKHGTTEASQLVNLVDFFKAQIVPDLTSANIDEFPVLKADAVKYVITFRGMLPRDILMNCFQPLVTLLRSKSNVVHSYAALAIDKLGVVKNPGGGAPFTSQELLPLRDQLFTNLFEALDLPGSSENDYIMKAIMRSCSLMKDGILPLVPVIITKLAAKLTLVAKNPSKPQFNHYLFESICTLIRAVGQTDKAAISQIEDTIFPVIQIILQAYVTEFLPYVFQVLSLAVDIRAEGVSGPYIALFPTLLQPVLWEQQGNVPALTKLLQAYIMRGSAAIVSGGHMMPLLGVFQKLIASKASDHEGFYLLSSMLEHISWAAMETYAKQIFKLLFQRLQTSKTTKYVKSFIVFVSLFAGLRSADVLEKILDSVQPRLFGMMVEKIFVADLQKVSGRTERKICAVGVTKLLTEVSSFFGPDYITQWTPLLQALIGLFELPEDDSIPDDEHFIDVEDTPGYQNAFSQLAYASKKENDPFQEVISPKEFLAKQLYQVSLRHPGKLLPLINQGLNPDASRFLQEYLNKAQVQIS